MSGECTARKHASFFTAASAHVNTETPLKENEHAMILEPPDPDPKLAEKRFFI